jgi:hypothetical protein
MALPSPTSTVSAGVTFATADIGTGVQVISRIVPPVVFKSLEVQYFGNLSIPAGSNYNFGPLAPITTWAVAYIRNLGGTGSGNTTVVFNPSPGAGGVNVVNLDVGALILYASPLLSSVTVQTIAAGLVSVNLVSAANTSSNLEVLLAG